MRKMLTALAVVSVLAFSLTGCLEEDTKGLGDAPVAGKHGDDKPATCTNMPDGFGNSCVKCLAGTHGQLLVANASGQFYVIADKNCP